MKQIFLIATLLLLSIFGYGQRVTTIYQDGLTHSTVKWSMTDKNEHYIIGARNGKLWTRKLIDIAVYQADYITMINTLQSALDFINTNPSKTDSLITDTMKIQYKRICGVKCISFTNLSNVSINTSKDILIGMIENIKYWENKKYTEN